MMYRISVLTIAVVVATCSATSAVDNELPKDVREAFEKATEFDLYSLDPSRLVKKDAKDDLFHEWKILGKTTLKGDAAKNVRAAIDKGRKDSNGLVAACFIPRHGVRIVHDKKTYDLVICYECLSATIFEGEKRIGSFLTTRSPEKTLTTTLQDAKVPLPKQRD